jgi:hypothetical protein
LRQQYIKSIKVNMGQPVNSHTKSWDHDNLIEKKIKINYEAHFAINLILKDKTRKNQLKKYRK